MSTSLFRTFLGKLPPRARKLSYALNILLLALVLSVQGGRKAENHLDVDSAEPANPPAAAEAFGNGTSKRGRAVESGHTRWEKVVKVDPGKTVSKLVGADFTPIAAGVQAMGFTSAEVDAFRELMHEIKDEVCRVERSRASFDIWGKRPFQPREDKRPLQMDLDREFLERLSSRVIEGCNAIFGGRGEVVSNLLFTDRVFNNLRYDRELSVAERGTLLMLFETVYGETVSRSGHRLSLANGAPRKTSSIERRYGHLLEKLNVTRP